MVRTVTIVVLGVLFFTNLSFSHAATSDSDTLQNATVNLYCKVKLGGRTYSTTGSGVFIDERGVILTNAHVAQYFLLSEGSRRAKGNCSVRTGSPAKDQYTASLLYISPTWIAGYADAVSDKTQTKGTGERDFALLYVTGTKNKKSALPTEFPALPLASLSLVSGLSEGTEIAITGYPAEGKDYKEVQKKLAQLTATTTITSIRYFERPYADVLVLGPTLAGRGGVSGGPITNTSDEVLGIVTTMGSDKGKLRSLRAISLVHVDRVLRADTGLSFPSLLLGNFATRRSFTLAALPSDVYTIIETVIRRIK